MEVRALWEVVLYILGGHGCGCAREQVDGRVGAGGHVDVDEIGMLLAPP